MKTLEEEYAERGLDNGPASPAPATWDDAEDWMFDAMEDDAEPAPDYWRNDAGEYRLG